MLEHLYSSDVNARLTIPEFTHKESKLQSPSYHAPPPTVAAPWLAPYFEPRCYYVRVLGLFFITGNCCLSSNNWCGKNHFITFIECNKISWGKHELQCYSVHQADINSWIAFIPLKSWHTQDGYINANKSRINKERLLINKKYTVRKKSLVSNFTGLVRSLWFDFWCQEEELGFLSPDCNLHSPLSACFLKIRFLFTNNLLKKLNILLKNILELSEFSPETVSFLYQLHILFFELTNFRVKLCNSLKFSHPGKECL